MEQYEDAVEKLKDPELRKQLEREAKLLDEEKPCRDHSYEDQKAERRELQKHFRQIQKEHSKR